MPVRWTPLWRRWNAKARALGSEDCRFINPNGLPPVNGQPDPYCSARDLALICEAADQLPDLRAMVRLKSYVFHKPGGKDVLLENTNRVLKSCDFCDGMKTGYTQAAGYCLVATGERDGRRRIVIVLNGTQSGVWRDAQSAAGLVAAGVRAGSEGHRAKGIELRA